MGWEYMKSEKFEEAARAFQNAIDLDQNYAFAYYGLGRADMALKRFTAAVIVLLKCRDIYGAEAGRQFSNAQELQQRRRDRLTELDEMTRQLSTGPQTQQAQQQNRQISQQRRMIEDAIARGNDVSIAESTVPAWLSLSLGSTFFRTGNLADAEKAYKATIEADSRSGRSVPEPGGRLHGNRSPERRRSGDPRGEEDGLQGKRAIRTGHSGS
jgi:tetratricopeptide (TPR) repeat protein